jgi:hypothetical protein
VVEGSRGMVDRHWAVSWYSPEIFLQIYQKEFDIFYA